MPNFDLNKKSVSAVKWAALGTVVRFALQLFTQVLLARLLGPESYGLFAMGLIVLTLSNFLADFGFSWGLVQNQDLTSEDVRFAFTWQLLSGSVATLGLFLLAPAIAAYFHEPRLAPVVSWLSLTCLLNALTAPGSNLLRRKLDFRWLNLIQIGSYVIGYLVVGVSLAYAGAGVWALVSAWLAQACSALVLTYLRSPHSVKPLFWYEGGRRSTSVGLTVFVTNLCNWFLNNLDRVFLGRLLNAHAVGLYTIGYNLANTPNSLFLTALQPAFLAAGAKLQDEPGRLREAYLSVIATVWIIIAPMFALLACAAGDLIAVLYGPAWAPSGQVLALLALAMPAYITWGMSTPILWNTGARHLESVLQMPLVLLAGAALLLFARYGVLAVAAIASVTLLLRAIVIGSVACRRLGITAVDLLPSAARGAALVGLTGLGTLAGAALAGRLGAVPAAAWGLAGGVLGGVALPALAALLHPGLLGIRVVDVLARFSPPVPLRLGVYLRSKCSIK